MGKGSLCEVIRSRHPEVWVSVSVTTRTPRPGETEGVDYCFVDDAVFDRLIADGALLEWALVHGLHRSGTPSGPVQQMLASGRPTLLEIDLQGARQVRAAMPTAQFVFLSPPSWDELVRRLVGRGTETPQQRNQRLRTARIEIAAEDEFDAVVVNDDLERAADALVALMTTSEH